MDENGGAKPTNFKIQEMNLQGVYPLTKVKNKQWLTKDDNATKLT